MTTDTPSIVTGGSLDKPPADLTIAQRLELDGYASRTADGAPHDGSPAAVTAARAKLAELKADAAFMSKATQPGPERKALMAAVEAAHHVADEFSQNYAETYATLQRNGLPPVSDPVGKNLYDLLAGKATVTAQERTDVERHLDALKRDPAWTKRYLDGGLAERAVMTKISVILAARVAEG
jgi:hypothetical protein